MKSLCTILVVFALFACAAASTPAVFIDEGGKHTTFSINGDVPSISVPFVSTATRHHITWANIADLDDKCNFDTENDIQSSYFFEDGENIRLSTDDEIGIPSTADLVSKCGFSDSNPSRNKRDYGLDSTLLNQDRTTYTILSNWLRVERTFANTITSVDRPLEIWYPKKLTAKKLVVAVGRDEFVVQAEVQSVEFLYSTTGGSANKWKVVLKTVTEYPYAIDSVDITPTERITASVEHTAGALKAGSTTDWEQTITFYVDSCQHFELSGPLLTLTPLCRAQDPAECSAESNPEQGSIDVQIQTADACPVTIGYNFGVPDILYNGGATASFTTSDNILISFKYALPTGFTTTFSVDSVTYCDSTTDAECSPTKTLTVVKEESSAVYDAAVSFPASALTSAPGATPSTFNLQFEITVTTEQSEKRSVMIQTEFSQIKIAKPDRSSASSIFSLLFLVVIALFA